MPFINVNFADVDSFEPLPPGEYDVEIDKVEVRENKAGDALYLNWELVVLDGDYENRRLWMITSLKDTALFRLKQVMEDLEVIDDDEEDFELEYDDDVEPSTSGGPRLLFPEVEELEAIATVKNEMYDGRERNRVEALSSGRSKKKRAKAAAPKSRNNDRKRDRDEDEEEERPRRRSSSRDSGRRRRVR